MEMSSDRWQSPVPHDHTVQFYEDERFLANCVARFLATGLRQGQPALVVAADPHRRAFLKRLRSTHGLDVKAAMSSGQLTLFDPRETLARIMVDGLPDAALVNEHIGGILGGILENHPGQRLCAYGEMVALLWRDGNTHAAVRLEELWNELANTYDFSLLCAYDITSFSRSSNGVGLREICQTHRHVIPAESYRETWTDQERRRAVTDLQVKAASSATEVEQRKALEGALRLALSARRSADRDTTSLQTDADGARDALERSQQATNEWLAEVVHGMRTPLNAILGWTQIVNLAPSDMATLQHAIGVIERNAENLNRLVNGLLEPRRGSVTSEP
jgi:KaiC/GvpD/RAD55 family RecA-like ATPase